MYLTGPVPGETEASTPSQIHLRAAATATSRSSSSSESTTPLNLEASKRK